MHTGRSKLDGIYTQAVELPSAIALLERDFLVQARVFLYHRLMAAFFTLPELRAELHSLGHDDVPDHVILAFLSQLQITIPNCFKGGKDRSPDPSRYIDPKHGADVKNMKKGLDFEHRSRTLLGDAIGDACQDEIHNSSWRNRDFTEQQAINMNRNVRFEENQNFHLQQQFCSKVDKDTDSKTDLGRPDTPPRYNAPVYVSDSEASKENPTGSLKGSGPTGHPSRQVLQPCDNVVPERLEKKKSSDLKAPMEQYFYPGDLLAQLKERQRPSSCPMLQQESSGDVTSDSYIRSFSAGGFYHNGECMLQRTRLHNRHKVAHDHQHDQEESSDYSSSKGTSLKDDCTNHSSLREDQSIDSLEVEEAIETFGVNLKPLNLGVIKHNTHRGIEVPAPISEDDCSADTGRIDIESLGEDRPSSRGTIRSNCAACQLLRESGTPTKFRHFSIRRHDGTPESTSIKLKHEATSGDSSPLSCIDHEGDDRKPSSLDSTLSPALQHRGSDLKSSSPSFSDVSNGSGNKKPMMRRGKIDRVARFAEMQKLWSKDNFLKATSGKRKSQSFHRMFAEIHASNEKEYAASRARSAMGIREHEELPPFVLTT